MVTFQYGAMSTLYSCEAENKLTAYATMAMHYNARAHLIALYEPKEIVANDSWMAIDGKIAARLDEIFGGASAFDKYCEENTELIKACYKTIKRHI